MIKKIILFLFHSLHSDLIVQPQSSNHVLTPKLTSRSSDTSQVNKSSCGSAKCGFGYSVEAVHKRIPQCSASAIWPIRWQDPQTHGVLATGWVIPELKEFRRQRRILPLMQVLSYRSQGLILALETRPHSFICSIKLNTLVQSTIVPLLSPSSSDHADIAGVKKRAHSIHNI